MQPTRIISSHCPDKVVKASLLYGASRNTRYAIFSTATRPPSTGPQPRASLWLPLRRVNGRSAAGAILCPRRWRLGEAHKLEMNRGSRESWFNFQVVRMILLVFEHVLGHIRIRSIPISAVQVFAGRLRGFSRGCFVRRRASSPKQACITRRCGSLSVCSHYLLAVPLKSF